MASIYATIIFVMTDQPWELNRYTRFTLVYVLVTIVADGLGLLLGAIANPVVSSYFVEMPLSNLVIKSLVCISLIICKTGFISENN